MLIGKNKFKMYKKALCLIFAFLLSIESFAAIVSDNDGSAFVTKAEFEALKSNFANQIYNYNNSIDSKIDGAVSSYLAGVEVARISTEKFPVCGNEKIVITNTKNIDDLQFGKVGIDWKLHITMIPSIMYSSGLHNGSAGTVSLSRSGDENYEAFVISSTSNATKFKYYGNKLKIDTEVNFCQVKATRNGASALDSADSLSTIRLRWGADPYGKAQRGEDESYVDSYGAALWSHFFGNNGFYAIYATGCNWGNLYHGGEATTRFIYQNNTSTVTIENDKIKWLIDDTDDASTVWVIDPEQTPQSLTDGDADNTVSTGREYTFPSDAGITGTLDITSCNYDIAATATRGYESRRNPLSGSYTVVWCDFGRYDNYSTPTSGQSTKWKEFHLVTGEETPSSLVNENFSNVILSEYKPYGFHGYVTEGIPLGIFKEGTSIEFDIDTTGQGGMNIGVKNTPFNTDNMANMVANSSIELTIDGVKQSKPVSYIRAGRHKIRIKNIDTQPLFIKFAMPRSGDPKERRILTWPEKYTLIDES